VPTRLLATLLVSLAVLATSGSAAAASSDLVICVRTGNTYIVCV
jgi:hypothetical protein